MMKPVSAAIMAIGLFVSATAAFATPTRAELETEALDHANKANDQVGIGVDAFKAGDKVKGCAAFRVAYDELSKAIVLLDQDAGVVRDDKTLSTDSRAKELGDIDGARQNAVRTRDLVDGQIRQRCA